MKKELKTIGRAEKVQIVDLGSERFHARIDTGARTSAIWGVGVVNSKGNLDVRFFDNPKYTHTYTEYGRTVVATSTGNVDRRFTIRTSISLSGKKIRATFTIANRSSQVYPILIGRNVLRGKFLVDVTRGSILRNAEAKRTESLKAMLEENEE